MSYQDLVERGYALNIKLQELQARFLETQIREREVMLDIYAQRVKLMELQLLTFNPLPRYVVGVNVVSLD